MTAAQWDDEGHGNVVIVDHGSGSHTFYSHLQDYPVEVGDVVIEGQSIGKVGSTGRLTTLAINLKIQSYS